MNDWDLIDEEIIRAAGELRPPRRRLRRRVLRAAKKARRKRQSRRRMLLAAALLLPAAAMGIWYQNAIDSGGASRSAALNERESIELPVDDWQRVDASINERRQRARAIRSSVLY